MMVTIIPARPRRAQPRAPLPVAMLLALLLAAAAAPPSASAASSSASAPAAAHGKHGKASCTKTVFVDPLAATAPRASAGQQCGPFLAVCARGLCCSQGGYCGDECGTMCQCSFSGDGSKCKGAYPPALPQNPLPVASLGDVCGAYVAPCPENSCCGEQSICLPATDDFCLSAGCQPDASGADGGVCSASSALRPGRVVRKTLVLGWTTAAPDGYSRPFISVNGRFPAENLRGIDVGDRLVITVVNNLGVSTAMHSHGFVQRRTAGSDGVATVTQRPIPDGQSFVYNFVADAPGTFWMHAHQKTQEADGFRFAVVVGDPASASGRINPPLYYGVGTAGVTHDDVITLSDLYHQMSDVLVKWYLSPAGQVGEPVPQGAMIDGISQAPGCVEAGDCTYRVVRAGAPVLCSAGADKYTTLLRVVSVGSMAVFRLSVRGGHLLKVVAADSTPVDEPELFASVVINVAQRYDLLVCQSGDGPPSSQPAEIRAEMIPGIFYEEPARPVVYGVLTYTGDDTQPPPGSLPPLLVPRPELNPLVPEALPAIYNPQRLRVRGNQSPPPGPADKTVRLALNFTAIKRDDPTVYAIFNNISFTFSPSSPSLMERYFGTPPGPPRQPSGARPAFGFNVQEVKTGDVVDVIIENQDSGEHPIHLHGLDGFWVMSYGLPNDGYYAPGKGKQGRVARDTETVNQVSFLRLRFVANNKGSIFILHCHLLWHLAAGLAMVFRTV